MLVLIKRVAGFFCLFFNATNYEAQSYFQIRCSAHRNVAAPEHNLPSRGENNTFNAAVIGN